MTVFLAVPAFAQSKGANDPLKGSYVRLIVRGGFTPFRVVTYDVFWRSGTGVAGNYRSLVNYEEPLHTMSLVARDEYLGLWKQLEQNGVWKAKSGGGAKGAYATLRYEIEIKRGKQHKKLLFTESTYRSGSKQTKLMHLIRDFVLKYAGEMPFRNVFFEPGLLGWVNITSAPSAKVLIGGRDIGLTTPVYGYEMPRGRHEITLLLPTGDTRKHTMTVEPGMTTIVHIDLQ